MARIGGGHLQGACNLAGRYRPVAFQIIQDFLAGSDGMASFSHSPKGIQTFRVSSCHTNNVIILTNLFLQIYFCVICLTLYSTNRYNNNSMLTANC